MKRFCFDNSGFTNPHVRMPEKVGVYRTLWGHMIDFVAAGHIATTQEVYDEMCHVPDDFGECIRENRSALVLEVGEGDWNFDGYIRHYRRMAKAYEAHLSEYTRMSAADTICLTDMTVIALAKTLDLPVVSEESSAAQSPIKRRIPDICLAEGVPHLYFNDFLERVGF